MLFIYLYHDDLWKSDLYFRPTTPKEQIFVILNFSFFLILLLIDRRVSLGLKAPAAVSQIPNLMTMTMVSQFRCSRDIRCRDCRISTQLHPCRCHLPQDTHSTASITIQLRQQRKLNLMKGQVYVWCIARYDMEQKRMQRYED